MFFIYYTNELDKCYNKNWIIIRFLFFLSIYIKNIIMGRPKLQEKDKKTKLGITINRELDELMDIETSNKSKFIENLIEQYFNKKNYGK
jgi:hypothetical protein